MAKCSDCGSAICADCCTECCGDSYLAVSANDYTCKFLCEKACSERTPVPIPYVSRTKPRSKRILATYDYFKSPCCRTPAESKFKTSTERLCRRLPQLIVNVILMGVFLSSMRSSLTHSCSSASNTPDG